MEDNRWPSRALKICRSGSNIALPGSNMCVEVDLKLVSEAGWSLVWVERKGPAMSYLLPYRLGVGVKCERWVGVTDGPCVCCVWLSWNDRLVEVASLVGLEYGGRLAWSLKSRFASGRKECWQFSWPLVEWSKLNVDSFFMHFPKTNNSQQKPRNVDAMALQVVSKFVNV